MNKLRLALLGVEGFTEFAGAMSDLWKEIWQIIVPIGKIGRASCRERVWTWV